MRVAFKVAWIGAGIAVFSLSGRADIRITQAVVDGEEHPFSSAEGQPPTLRFSGSAKKIIFQFSEISDNAPAFRLKYKLEGYDTEWHELPAQMVVLLRLINKNGSILAGDQLNLSGETPGWNGHADTTPLIEQTMFLTAPCAADHLWAYFISNGGSETIGQMVVDDVRVRIDHQGHLPTEQIAVDMRTGEHMDQPLGLPSSWKREGSRPNLAQILHRREAGHRPVLFLNDDDPEKFGVWRSPNITSPIAPGDTLTLSWKMAHTIGRVGPGTAEYAGLRPGSYWFRVAGFLPDGRPTGQETALSVTVLPPFYRRTEFWLVMTLFACTFAFLAARLILWRRMKRRLQMSERHRLLESERMRIARDIHDDLGASLAQIAMLSEMAEDDARQNRPIASLLHDIFTRARDTTRKLDEIVWAIKPANDTLEHLVGYLCQFAETYLALAGLRFRFDAPETLPAYTLTSGQRHNLFLAAKEALHNIVKHAHASEVWLRVRIDGCVLSLRIEDNGSGCVPEPDTPPTRGSANMRTRMEQIGGTYRRTGLPSKGTTVELTFPLKEQKL